MMSGAGEVGDYHWGSGVRYNYSPALMDCDRLYGWPPSRQLGMAKSDPPAWGMPKWFYFVLSSMRKMAFFLRDVIYGRHIHA